MVPLRRIGRHVLRNVRPTGRTSRVDFWFFVIVFNLFLINIPTLGEHVDNRFVDIVITTMLVAGIYLVVSATVRRMHDIGRSPWWLLAGPAAGLLFFGGGEHFYRLDLPPGIATGLLMAPFVALMIAAGLTLILLAWPSDPEANRYGPPPPHILSRNGPTGPQPE